MKLCQLCRQGGGYTATRLKKHCLLRSPTYCSSGGDNSGCDSTNGNATATHMWWATRLLCDCGVPVYWWVARISVLSDSHFKEDLKKKIVIRKFSDMNRTHWVHCTFHAIKLWFHETFYWTWVLTKVQLGVRLLWKVSSSFSPSGVTTTVSRRPPSHSVLCILFSRTSWPHVLFHLYP